MTIYRLLLIFNLAICNLLVFGSDYLPIHDTIRLNIDHVEGRWIEQLQDDTKKSNIYVFRSDYSFHKAIDDTDILLFNITGSFVLLDDKIKIHYQDFSRPLNRKPKVRVMTFRVIALSDDELNIYKTEDNKTQFIQLTRLHVK